jgi:hypothetical protein
MRFVREKGVAGARFRPIESGDRKRLANDPFAFDTCDAPPDAFDLPQPAAVRHDDAADAALQKRLDAAVAAGADLETRRRIVEKHYGPTAGPAARLMSLPPLTRLSPPTARLVKPRRKHKPRRVEAPAMFDDPNSPLARLVEDYYADQRAPPQGGMMTAVGIVEAGRRARGESAPAFEPAPPQPQVQQGWSAEAIIRAGALARTPIGAMPRKVEMLIAGPTQPTEKWSAAEIIKAAQKARDSKLGLFPCR